MPITFSSIIGVVYILVGMLLYKFFGKQLDQFYNAIVKPKKRQNPASVIPTDSLRCSQCGLIIAKENYLVHLQNTHGLDVRKFVQDLGTVAS